MGELMKYSRNLHNNSNKNGFNLQLSQVHNGENKENISVNTLVIKQVTQQKQEKPRRKRHSAGNIHQLQLQNFNNNYLITNYNNNNNNKSNNNNNVMKPQYTQVVPQMQTTPLPIIDADTYDIKTKIGEGSFGKIYLVEKNNTKYALKKIVATTPHEISNLRHEYEILSYLSTNLKINIITIHGTQSKHLDRTTYVLYILMELAETDWEKEISTRSKTASYYTESELIFILKSLTKTFSLLQKESISHRDIKPQNILICPHNIFKVADFGEAKELLKNKSNTDNQTIRGTELFMSPILFKAVRNRKCIIVKHNSYKSDVFSLGLCILYAATLTVNSIYDLRELITNIEIENVVRRYINKRYSEKFIKVIMKMLNYNEKERCDFIEMENVINKEFM
jgi:serine/threonine protein kinase